MDCFLHPNGLLVFIISILGVQNFCVFKYYLVFDVHLKSTLLLLHIKKISQHFCFKFFKKKCFLGIINVLGLTKLHIKLIKHVI